MILNKILNYKWNATMSIVILQSKHNTLCNSGWDDLRMHYVNVITYGLQETNIDIQSLVTVWLFISSLISHYICSSIDKFDNRIRPSRRLWWPNLWTIGAHLLPDQNIGISFEKNSTSAWYSFWVHSATQSYLRVCICIWYNWLDKNISIVMC